jgi:hypothetical protein
MSLAKQEFTNAGRAMLGRAQNGEVLHITKIVVGSGTVSSAEEIWPLTQLVTQEMEVTLTAKRDYGDGTMLVEGSFNSDAAPHAFFLKEVGVMAHVETGGLTEQPPTATDTSNAPPPARVEADRLYSASNVLLEPADYIDPAVPTIQAFKIKLVIDRIPTESVVVEIGPSENVIGENVGADSVGPGVYHEAAGNVLRFKRLVEGPGIELTEAADEHSIEIAARQLRNNVDLYVPEDHPDAPNHDVAFPSIQDAHDYLLGFRIPADKFATIHVYKGTLVVHSTTLFSHPDSAQINVIGYPRLDKTVTSIVFQAGTPPAPNYKRLAIADISGLAQYTYGYLTNCAGAWAGGCQIVGTPHANDVLASIEKRDTRGNYTTQANAQNQRFSTYPTLIDGRTIPAGANPVFSCPYGIGKIENICALGAWASFSLRDGTIKNCMGWGSVRGINNAGGTVSIQGECCFTQCDFGITGLGVVTAFESPTLPMWLHINACTQGITPSGSGFAIGSITGNMPNTRVYLCRNFYGVNLGGGAYMEGGSFIYCYNDNGFRCSVNSTLFLGAAYGSEPQGNLVDIYAQGMSYVQYDRHGYAAPICIPQPGVPDNDFAYIKVLNTV